LACSKAGEGPERSTIPEEFGFEGDVEFEDPEAIVVVGDLRVRVVRCTIYAYHRHEIPRMFSEIDGSFVSSVPFHPPSTTGDRRGRGLLEV
jgi:hypothetical protein